MTTITIEKPIKLEKTHFKNIDELFFVVNIAKKNHKLSPVELINKYKLNQKYTGKKIDIANEIHHLAYNI